MNAKEIKNIILTIGKATITFSNSSKDYLFNGKNPREVQGNYYHDLFVSFETHFLIQLKENCTPVLIEKYIEYAKKENKKLSELRDKHRVAFIFQKSKGELSEAANYTHNDVMIRLSTQINTLNAVIRRLTDELEFVDYRTSQDFIKQSLTPSTESLNQLVFPNVGKITFNLSKKESLMLLYILEQKQILSFESDAQRNKFIENNFNFIEQRANIHKGEAIPMKDVNTDISKLKAGHWADENNKVLKKLVHAIETVFLEFKFVK